MLGAARKRVAHFSGGRGAATLIGIIGWVFPDPSKYKKNSYRGKYIKKIMNPPNFK